jgi:sugar (pentulose or hexulose) kinase
MAGQRAPLWNDATAGVVLGITPATERRHLARMFMESVALGARHVFEELCPVRPERAALTGGITHSRAWTQLMADVTGMRLSVWDQAETSTIGAAVLAGVGVGMFRSPAAALARVPRPSVLEPDPRHREYYDALYAIFSEAYASVLGPLASLDALRRAGAPTRARAEVGV